MIAKKCTNDDLQQALDLVNARYQGNVEFNNFTPKGKSIVFTLRVRDSKGPGARRSHSGRRLVSACWHVHGHYFECLFSINPKAEVYSSRSGWITISGGNWQDFEIGSMMEPLRMSQACDCNKGAQQNIERLIPGRVAFKTLTQSQIKTCPICSFDPTHYETPYGCLCADPNAQDQKKRERQERRDKYMKHAKEVLAMIKVDLLDTLTNKTIEIRLTFNDKEAFRRFHADGRDLQVEDEVLRAKIEKSINEEG